MFDLTEVDSEASGADADEGGEGGESEVEDCPI